jgi:beta-carotene isomerase
MRASVRAGAPSFLFETNHLLDAASEIVRGVVPKETAREVTAIVASEAAEWMFGPTSRVTSGAVTVVTIKKCRYLEATGCVGVCASMCKLPAQDVVFSEFGVPLHVEPDFTTGSCRMHFGKTPPPERIDPALNAKCLEGCSRAVTFAEYGQSIDEKDDVEYDDRCGALPARARG